MSQDRIREVAKKFKKDFPLYSRHVLKVIDKAGTKRPLILNAAQAHVHALVEQQKRETGRVRTLALKARQLGISTYVEARYFHKVTSTRNASAFVLSHLAESTAAIFRMVNTFYDNVPHAAFKPPLLSRTSTSLQFDLINSQFRVGTARTGQTGRGQTNQLVHGSEVAFYPDPELIVAGLLQTVNPVGTEVILESTANGVGGWFYERCMECLDGNNEWQLVFCPWFIMPEYRMKVPEGFLRTEEEELLVAQFKLDDAQLQFRRVKIDELGSEMLFRQEYPATVREAFITSGRPIVDIKHLDSAEVECWSPQMLGEITDSGFIHTNQGRLKVWSPPKPDERYVIGADVAEGLEKGDYSCAQVLDSRGRQVACWHGHTDPHEFGAVLNMLGRWYRKAWMLVERNNHGLTTLRRLEELGYPSLYVEQELDHAYHDKLTKRAGWLTTAKSKPVIIDNLAQLVRTGESGIADLALVHELRTYVVDERGRTNAQEGCFDDRVMAYAIALFGLNSMPRPKPFVRRQHTPVDPMVGY